MSRYFSDELQQLQENAATSALTFRREALAAFQDYGLPRRKQDPWKYIDNSALLNLPFPAAPNYSEGPVPQVPAEAQAPEHSGGANIFHFHNGESRALAPAIRALNLQDDLAQNAREWRLDKNSLLAEENSYSLLNAFSFRHAYKLTLPVNSRSVVRLCFSGAQIYQAPRLYLEVAANCDVTLLLDSRQLGFGVYWNPYFFVTLGENSHLTLLERGPRLWDGGAVNNGQSPHVRSVTLRMQIAAGALVSSALFYWGTTLAIHDARFAICGKNASVQARGICFGEDSSRYHLRGEMQHLAEDSSSQSLYKNVLYDRATSEFYGIIHVDNNGSGTDAVQKNQNLLLSEQARAIARPQLEIEIDDLKCSHGSATGSINAEELFYMRSRGLSQSEAMRLAVVGFVEEISTYFAPELLAELGIEDCLHTLLEKRNH